MATNIVQTDDIQQLLEGWLDAERNGVEFPVPLHDYWGIAGHTTKRKALDLAKSILDSGIDFLTIGSKNAQGLDSGESKRGRPSERLLITVAGLEHLCMAAKTPQGKNVRELYRQAKAKWDLVQKHAPQVASDVELLHLQIELAKIEAQKEVAISSGKQADLQLVQFRHIVTTTMPEVVQQKILGYSEIKTVEYRDRIIKEDEIIRDGSTLSRSEVCRRLGIMRGKQPDCKRLDQLLLNLPSEATRLSAVVQDYIEVNVEYLPEIRELWLSGNRQQYLGE